MFFRFRCSHCALTPLHSQISEKTTQNTHFPTFPKPVGGYFQRKIKAFWRFLVKLLFLYTHIIFRNFKSYTSSNSPYSHKKKIFLSYYIYPYVFHIKLKIIFKTLSFSASNHVDNHDHKNPYII